MEIVFTSQVLEREVARAVNDPNDGSVLNPLTVLAVMFSGLVFQSRQRVSLVFGGSFHNGNARYE